MSTFSERAMLVSLTIHGWTARKKDEDITQEVHRLHGAAADSGNYTKLLVSADSLKPIKAADSALRSHHYAHTLAWSDSNERILPVAMFERYMEGIRRLLDNRDTAVAAFLHEYQVLVDLARVKLNSLFNEYDYPTPDELRGRFRVDLRNWPFPDIRDFRIDLGEDHMQTIRHGLAEQTLAAERETVRECFRRLHDHVQRMAARLSVPIGEEGARFTDTLVTGLEELVELLPLLNVTGDPDLDRLAHEAKARLIVPPEMLRNSASTRSQTAANARDMMRKLETYAAALAPEETP